MPRACTLYDEGNERLSYILYEDGAENIRYDWKERQTEEWDSHEYPLATARFSAYGEVDIANARLFCVLNPKSQIKE